MKNITVMVICATVCHPTPTATKPQYSTTKTKAANYENILIP